MSDEQMDARLSAAGERWRADNAEAADPAAVTTVPVDDSSQGAVRRRRPRRSWLAVAASVVVVAAAAAGIGLAVVGDGNRPHRTTTGGAGSALRGAWMLTSFAPVPSGQVPRIEAGLSFGSDGTLVGSDGCNTTGGQAEIAADTFTVRNRYTTLMECVDQDPAVVAFTDAVDNLLSGTVHWTVAGDQLTLTNASVTLTYRRVDAGGSHDPNLLPETLWRLNTIADPGNDGSASSSSDYEGITLMFTGGPGFVVTYLCVTESGQAVAGDGKLTLKVLDSRDAKPCASVMSDTDQQVRRRLTGPLTWSIVAGQLVVTKEGAGSLTFEGVARPTDTPRPTTS